MNIVSDDLRGAKGLLSILVDVIQNDDKESLENILDRIVFNEMDFDKALSLILGLLNICMDSDSGKIAKIIYDKNEEFYPLTSEIDFITILFLNEKVSIDLLNFLISDVLSGYALFRLVHQLTLVSGYDSSKIVQAIYKCWKVFPIPTLEGLQQLYDYTVKVSSTIANEIAVKLRENNKFATVPTWLISMDILPKESSFIVSSAMTDETTELGLPDLDTILSLIHI